jgi:hypothetical protein
VKIHELTTDYQLINMCFKEYYQQQNWLFPPSIEELNDIAIRSSITIDPEIGKRYFQDGFYLYCVKQPKVL